MARKRKHNPNEIKELLEQYIKETDIPIVAEFAYKNNVLRSYLYEIPEISDTIKKLIDKKESQLELLALKKEINASMAIFSLKQLGWKDTQETSVNLSTEEKTNLKQAIKQFAKSNS